MSLRPPQRAIIRAFYRLVVIVTVATVLFAGLGMAAFNADSRTRDDLDRFHLRSLAIISEMSTRVSQVRGDVVGPFVTGDELSPHEQRELTNVIYALAQNTDGLIELQDEHTHAEFVGTLQRLERATSRLLDVEPASLGAAELDAHFEALELSLFQLSRLHSITVESELQTIGASNQRILTTMLVAVPILVGVGAVLVRRLLRLLRRRLQEYEESQDALLESERRLERSQRLDALGTLVGGVAHDFNNLLMVINLHADTARRDLADDDPTRHALGEILGAGEAAANLTAQLLTFSRQRAGTPEVIDLRQVIDGAAPVLCGLLREDIQLDIDHSETPPPVMVDPHQMQQVLINLVVNARDAMPGSGHLSIRTGAATVVAGEGDVPAGHYTWLGVEDTGSGMQPDVRARAFEPFFTTKEFGRGTGLGLSMVHGIITNAGGYLSVDSEPGRGTRFDIYLPAVTEPAAHPAPEVGDVATGTETILLVEDESQIRRPISAALREHGYHVIEADNAEDPAIAQAEESGEIDLVVTDIVMPGIRGTTLVELLRRTDPDIRAVFMSGYVDDDVLAGVIDSGDAFVPKPFQVRDMLDSIRRELDREVVAAGGDSITA